MYSELDSLRRQGDRRDGAGRRVADARILRDVARRLLTCESGPGWFTSPVGTLRHLHAQAPSSRTSGEHSAERRQRWLSRCEVPGAGVAASTRCSVSSGRILGATIAHGMTVPEYPIAFWNSASAPDGSCPCRRPETTLRSSALLSRPRRSRSSAVSPSPPRCSVPSSFASAVDRGAEFGFDGVETRHQLAPLLDRLVAGFQLVDFGSDFRCPNGQLCRRFHASPRQFCGLRPRYR